MVHSVCREGGPDTPEMGFGYVRQLWARLLDPDRDFAAKLEDVLATETAEFDLSYAFLSRIDRDERTQHIEIAHGDHDLLQPGEAVSLGKTYCRRTIADPDGSMAVSDAPAEGWADDPAHETFGLDSYLGTTVTVDDELYGTLCFASSEPRGEPITDREVVLAEMLGRWASYELARNGHGSPQPREHGDADRRDRRATSPDPRLDDLLDALRARERRAVLLGLREGTVRDRTDVTVDGTAPDALGTALRHNHLPKLASAGLVDWDPETGRIARGPEFEAVEPLLDALAAYADERRTDGPDRDER